jgi:hypothetical protein
MKLSTLGLGAVLLSAGSSSALATPIAYGEGVADGVLRTYTFVESADHLTQDLVLVRDYEIGTDFYPTIPQSFVDNALLYSRCVGVSGSVLNLPSRMPVALLAGDDRAVRARGPA